jgi:hypothetical protein
VVSVLKGLSQAGISIIATNHTVIIITTIIIITLPPCAPAEPTSGLDSFQAQSVVSALKGLSQAGRSIIAAIHQPRSSIFQVKPVTTQAVTPPIVTPTRPDSSCPYTTPPARCFTPYVTLKPCDPMALGEYASDKMGVAKVGGDNLGQILG